MEIEIDYIRSCPVCAKNIHESIFQSYQILEKVTTKLKRGDSKETVLEMIAYLKKTHGEDELK